VVIQERLSGPEVSAFGVSDGTNVVMLPFVQDHKRLKDNDQGPNTGGMGTFAPLSASIVGADQTTKIHDIITRTIAGMQADGMPFQGVLFVGLMLAAERGGDPVVIEYNVRFGDPETEVLLTTLSQEGFDVAGLLLQAAAGDISGITAPPQLSTSAVSVCLAAAGYPEKVRTGDEIHGLDASYQQVIVHQAATTLQDGVTRTDGGRVLYVTGLGSNPDEAAAHAYAAIGPQAIHFDGMQYRTDIGRQVRTK
jgi:phosphoribosylamine--glycine ligase